MKGAFIVAADRVRQGPLYRGSLYSEKIGRARNWPLWAGDCFTEVSVKAGLTVYLYKDIYMYMYERNVHL